MTLQDSAEQRYEADRREMPYFHDQQPRPPWADLPEPIKDLWRKQDITRIKRCVSAKP